MLEAAIMISAIDLSDKKDSRKMVSAIKKFEKAIKGLKRSGITSMDITLTQEDIRIINTIADGADCVKVKVALP